MKLLNIGEYNFYLWQCSKREEKIHYKINALTYIMKNEDIKDIFESSPYELWQIFKRKSRILDSVYLEKLLKIGEYNFYLLPYSKR